MKIHEHIPGCMGEGNRKTKQKKQGSRSWRFSIAESRLVG